jgi:hypothetical protein
MGQPQSQEDTVAKGDISNNPANQLSGVGSNARYRHEHADGEVALDPTAEPVRAANYTTAYLPLPDFGPAPDVKAVEEAGKNIEFYSPADVEKLFETVVSLIDSDPERTRRGAGRESFELTPDLTR